MLPRLVRVSFQSETAVLLVTIGTIGLVVVSVPPLRWFLILTLGAGAVFALARLVWSTRHPAAAPSRERLDPVSINIARVPIAGSLTGLIVTVGCLAIVLFDLPVSRWFFAGALGAGLILAVALAWWHRRSPSSAPTAVVLGNERQ